MDVRQHRLARAIAQFVEWMTAGFVTKDEALEWLSFGFRAWHHPDVGRRRGVRHLALVCALLAGLYGFREWWIPAVDRPALIATLIGNCWVSYDPRSSSEAGGGPNRAELQRDMAAIRRAGFTGVVTFSSAGSLATIPEIAHANGLRTIMGIWDPTNPTELRAAIDQRRFTSAYAVGHYRLDAPGGYSLDDLRQSVDKLKRETWRPVAISEAIARYSDPRIASLGDWLFPDVHPRLLDEASGQLQSHIPRDVALTLADVQDVAAVAQRHDRVLLLKMLTYPWHGVLDTSLERQHQFYAAFVETLRSNQSHLAVRVNFVAHSAFDAPWKIGRQYRPWDPFTGLLEQDGRPRPAVREAVRECH